MQINRVSPKYPQQTNYRNNKGHTPQSNKNKTQSFKGLGGLDKACLGLANLIENGGLFVSFTLQDMLGTNLPRPIMGLRRNSKENKGEMNKNFAFKELVREMLTGPSMFLIPMGLLKIGKGPLGQTINTPMNFIKSFGEIHVANSINSKNNPITKQEFFEHTFSEIIKNASNTSEISPEIQKKAASFAEKLQGSISKSAQDKNIVKKTISELSDEFVDIAKQHADDVAHNDFTIAKVKGAAAPFKEVATHMMSYADDVVEKATQQKNIPTLNNYINKLTNKKIIGRFATNAIMYASIITFLQIIPKLYNKAEGKDNAGLKGLMKEETLNSNSSTEKSQSKSQPSFGRSQNAQPSFGSAASVASKLTSSSVIGKIAKAFEFEGYNVSFPLLLGIMGFGVLIPRTIQAKDKYDREEILRRDLVTCATMCFAEKELRKGFSKLNEVKSGLVLAAKDKSFKDKSLPKKIFEYLRPINGVQVLSTEQIVSKYSRIDKYNGGLKGFCDFIEGQGGNLKKVLSLTDESKGLLENILKNNGQDIASADNKTIKQAIASAIDSDDVKKLTDLFKNKNNPWVQKAKTLNARFTALSVCVLVPVFLGFLLPAINERATKKRIREEQALNNKNLNTSTVTNTNFLLKQKQTPEVFKDIMNYTK